jgi:hypothetical protein
MVNKLDIPIFLENLLQLPEVFVVPGEDGIQ